VSDTPGYLIDSDVLITAKNSYYAFDFCPGFWDAILQGLEQGRVRSIDRVKTELLNGTSDDPLVEWVNEVVPAAFFVSTTESEVVEAFQSIMLWVQQHPQYTPPAKAKFASGADGWLVAHASVHGEKVVTLEQPAPESQNSVKIPDVCNQFGVSTSTPFSMLRDLAVTFRL
jgi:hypothetical protein